MPSGWTLSAFADEAGGGTDNQIAVLKKANITYIDPRGVDGTNICDLPLDKAQEVAGKYEKAGIRVGMFGSPIGKIGMNDDFQIDLDRLSHLGKLKDVFGCSSVRMFSYYNKDQALSAGEFEAGALDRLKQLRDLAGKLGLKLYHENESRIYGERLETVLKIAELRDPQTFGLIFDFDNYNHAGVEEDVWANWQALADKTDAFHLKDSNAQHQHVPIGQGAGQARRILADAHARGWTGMLSLEPHLARSAAVLATGPSGEVSAAYSDKTPEECFQIAAEAAHDLLEQIDKAAV